MVRRRSATEDRVPDPVLPKKRKQSEILADYAVEKGIAPETEGDSYKWLSCGITDERIQTSDGKILPSKKVFGKITYGEVAEAIKESSGLITGVARRLGISVYYVKQIFSKYKTLARDFEEFREIVLDELEVAFLSKARLGDTASLIFALKCLGKNRGYVEFGLPQQKKSGVKIKIVPAKAGKVVKMVPPKKKVGNG